MEKCWFVLRQTHYPAPVYKRPGMAFGDAEGPVLLGHFIPHHRQLDNVINSEGITPFPKGMRIWPTTIVDFRFSQKSDKDSAASASAAAPVAAAAGVTLGAEARVVFKRVMGDTWEVDRLETQIVQPSIRYLKDCFKPPSELATWVDGHKLSQWKAYMISGLIIARGGRRNRTEGATNSAGAGSSAEVPEVAEAAMNLSRTSETELGISGEHLNDFVWAVRLTEVSKSLFTSEIRQRIFTKGATLQPGSDKLDVEAVLKEQDEKVEDVEVMKVFNGSTEEAFIII